MLMKLTDILPIRIPILEGRIEANLGERVTRASSFLVYRPLAADVSFNQPTDCPVDPLSGKRSDRPTGVSS